MACAWRNRWGWAVSSTGNTATSPPAAQAVRPVAAWPAMAVDPLVQPRLERDDLAARR